MRRAFIGLFAFTLAGCQSPAERALEQYNLVANSKISTQDEKCAAARDVQAAYLKEQNTFQYETWHVHADIDCQSAYLKHLTG